MKELFNMIFKRKSFHLFRGVGDEKINSQEIEDINSYCQNLVPLYPDIKTAIKIVPENQTTSKSGAEYCILFYSEKKDGYLQNIGYIGQQLDLYLTSKNIGTLWYGIGTVKEKKFLCCDYVIMIAIRKVDEESKFRKDMFLSKRKLLEEIWEGENIDNVSNIVRFSPSACNSQPWLVKNENNTLSVFRCVKLGKVGIMPIVKVGFYNQIDMGIFLCILDICLEHKGINFNRELFCEKKVDGGLMLNAKYKLL